MRDAERGDTGIMDNSASLVGTRFESLQNLGEIIGFANHAFGRQPTPSAAGSPKIWRVVPAKSASSR